MLHGQTRDGLAEFRDSSTMTDVYTRRDFTAAMDRIDIPVFGSLQFQDEQTSSVPMRFIDRLTSHNPRVWMNFTAGRHDDAVSPDTIIDLFQFLDIYVAGRTPEIKGGLYLIAPSVFRNNQVQLPLPSLLGLPLTEARRRWESRPTFRYGFERAGTLSTGATGPRWSFTSSSFPPLATSTERWHFAADGGLGTPMPTGGSASWVSDPSRRPETFAREWSTVPAGAGVGFVSAPMDRTKVVLGPISADLWLSSTAPDTDVQVTISEIRPDGSEMFVTTGVQRASQRTIDPATDSELEPGHSFVRPTLRCK